MHPRPVIGPGRLAPIVPSTWTVKHDLNCPNTTGRGPGPGTLLLGLPTVIDHRPAYH